MDYLLTPMERILNHMRNELEELRKGYMTPDSLEHLDQIERDIQQLEEIAWHSRGVMSFQ